MARSGSFDDVGRSPRKRSDDPFQDVDFLDNLILVLQHDRKALQELAGDLHSNDFAPLPWEGESHKGEGRARWSVGGQILTHWTKHKEPLGSQLRAQVLAHGRELQMGESWFAEVTAYLDRQRKKKPTARDATLDLVRTKMRHRREVRAADEYLTARAAGTITDAARREFAAVLTSSDGLAQSVERLTRKASEIEPRRLTWLWPDRIPLGKVSLLVGPPDQGKSLLTIHMAATVTRGRQWPDGHKAPRGRVVLASGEDDLSDTIVPRLQAADADLRGVHVYDVAQGLDLGKDIDKLDALITRLKSVRLLVVDPVSAFLGRIDSHKNADVRGVLAPLAALAAKHELAVVCITHLSKSGGPDALSRVIGSVAFGAFARSVWLVCRDPDDPDRRLLLPVKNNLSQGRTGLGFAIESVETEGLGNQPRIAWREGIVADTADKILAAANEDPERHSELEAAAEWLREALQSAPRRQLRASQIYSESRATGITRGTLWRAKNKLGIEAFKPSAKNAGWVWRLPAGEVRARAADGEGFADDPLPDSSNPSNPSNPSNSSSGPERRRLGDRRRRVRPRLQGDESVLG